MFGRRRATLPDPRADYESRRQVALTRTPASIGWTPSVRLPDVWAGLVETGLPWGGSTLVVMADGSAELFTSPGKHWLGGEPGDDDVRAATLGLLLVLQARLDAFEPDEELTLPPAGYVRMRALTLDGQRSVTAPERPLEEGIHALSTVHFAAQEVVRQLTVHGPD